MGSKRRALQPPSRVLFVEIDIDIDIDIDLDIDIDINIDIGHRHGAHLPRYITPTVT